MQDLTLERLADPETVITPPMHGITSDSVKLTSGKYQCWKIFSMINDVRMLLRCEEVNEDDYFFLMQHSDGSRYMIHGSREAIASLLPEGVTFEEVDNDISVMYLLPQKEAA